MVEIERKFLLKSDAFKAASHSHSRIAQGYLNSDPERTVRIRIRGESGFLTIKGRSNNSGTTRLEWETELPLFEAEPLLALCEAGIIEKIRYLVNFGKHTIEVDEFHGDNLGLYIAEIELSNENDVILKPDWLGSEVTNDPRYYNSALSKNPYKNWK